MMPSNIGYNLNNNGLNSNLSQNKMSLNNNKKTDKDSIFGESSDENEKNDENENNNTYNSNENKKNFNKEIIDINEQDNNLVENSKDNQNNTNAINNFFNKNINFANLIINNDNNNNIEENVSRSMSSHHSNKSSETPRNQNRSRSRSNRYSSPNNYYKNNSNNFGINNNNNNFSRKTNRFNNSGNKFQNMNNNKRNNNTYNNNSNTFVMKNGCCRDCMKAFSKNGKSCLCQVPKRERKYFLSENGCNYCGCKGCNPIDVKYNERKEHKRLLYQEKNIPHKNQRIIDSEDEDLKIKDEDVDNYNIEKREIQQDLNYILKINSIFYGYGTPLRSPSYILGYNPKYINPKKSDKINTSSDLTNTNNVKNRRVNNNFRMDNNTILMNNMNIQKFRK